MYNRWPDFIGEEFRRTIRSLSFTVFLGQLAIFDEKKNSADEKNHSFFFV